MKWLATTVLAFLLLAPSAIAQPGGGQAMDADFAARVREWTTRPEFLSPLVDHLPLSDSVPSPRQILGHHAGAPRELTYYAEMLDYYRALADASPRVSIRSIGRTDEDREMVVVTIAGEATLAELERHRRDLARLADPRGLTEAEAQTVVARAKPIYLLMAGLHSGETGPPEMLMELAYRLAVEEGPLFDRIRDELIVALIPAAEPDGRDRYVDWYYRHLIDITDDRDRIGGPPYWGKYIFHDNNRDINYSQRSMRNLLDWYLRWHPPVMHDLHESIPFLYTFSGQAPQNPLLDPIVYGELPWFANFEMAQLTSYGMPGVWTHGFVDMWSPGYLAFMASNHNGLIRFYETFGNGGATTMKRHLKTEDNTPEQARTSREWYRPSPPYEEVEWSMRNNTNYSQTAALTALQLASSNPEVIVRNFYRKSRNAVADGERNPPHGFVVPAGQRDMTRVATLVDLLRIQGRRGRPVGRRARAGRRDLARRVIRHQGPPAVLPAREDPPRKPGVPRRRTADVRRHGLDHGPRCTGRRWSPSRTPRCSTRRSSPSRRRGSTARSRGTARRASATPSPTTARTTWRRCATGSALRSGRGRRGRLRGAAAWNSRPGSFIIPATAAGAERGANGMVELDRTELGLTAAALDERPEVAAHPVDLPRLAIYSTWGNTQEVGWVRHAFDQFEIPFESDLQGARSGGRPAGGLRRRPGPEPGPHRQGPGVRHRAARRAAGLHENGPLSLPGRLRLLGGHHGRDGNRGRPGAAAVRGRRRAAGDARSRELRPAGVRPDPRDRRPPPRLRASTLPGPLVEAEIDAAGTSDLLRLRDEEDAGALRERTPAGRAAPVP